MSSAFLLAPAAALAGDDADSIIVTATSIEQTLPQELARYGNDLDVLSGETVRDRGAVDLATALDAIPGLYIRPGSGPFSYVDLSLQGSRTADVLWTVDGVRINNRLYAGTSPNDTIPASLIERVEVLKGGESLFYGTQAVAGVINVVTRDFTADWNGQVNGSVDSRAGTMLDGYVRGSAGGHRFVAWGSRNRAEGYRPFNVIQPSATDRRRGYRHWSAGGKYQVDLADGLHLNLLYNHVEARLDNLSAARTRTSRNDRNEEIASVRLDYVASDAAQLFLKGYLHDWKTAYVQILNPVQPGPPVVIYPPGTFWGYRDYGGSALVKLRLHPGLEYLAAYEYQQYRGRDDVLLIGRTNEKAHAGSFQVRTTDDLWRNGRLAAGVRHNRTGDTDSTIWNVSGRYDVADALYVQGNAGTAFLLPDASQLYSIDPCCEVGNPNLKPERSLNFNGSVGGRVAAGGADFSWQLTYFARRITDLITAIYDDPAFPDGTYANVGGKVRMRGGEAQLALLLPGGWQATASYTHTRTRNPGASVQRDRVPKDFAKGALSWNPPTLPVGANAAVSWIGDAYSSVTGFGRRNYGNYAVVDLGAHLYVDGLARRHRLGVNVENLFDKDYATRGLSSAAADAGGRFLFFARGVPRTLRINYSVAI